MKTIREKLIERPAIVSVLGHVDHGKSTLLDYIRKGNTVEQEEGGITQHLGVYEVKHKSSEGYEVSLTFLDTPGHEAFGGMRHRGAEVSDVSILVVSAEEGVKEQTLDAVRHIKAAARPMIVAVSKIDKPTANLERAKQNLIENEIYLEGYGGQVPWVAISSKTGEGISELLDLTVLSVGLENLTAHPDRPASGYVIESELDSRRGVSATLIIKDGVLRRGMAIAAGGSLTPVRFIENAAGEKVTEALYGSAVRIIGWDSVPLVGIPFEAYPSKHEAEEAARRRRIEASKGKRVTKKKEEAGQPDRVVLSLALKADVSGTLEAIKREVNKRSSENVELRTIHVGIGSITENDIKITSGRKSVFLIGFNVGIDASAAALAERLGLKVELFTVIYKLSEYLDKLLEENTPKQTIEEVTGRAKILRFFSKTKEKQIVGGLVEDGSISQGSEVRIMRRGVEIGSGRLRNLEQMKIKIDEVKKGMEFGALIESRIEIAPADTLECIALRIK